MGWLEISNCDVSELPAGHAPPQYRARLPDHGHASPQYRAISPGYGSAGKSPCQELPAGQAPSEQKAVTPPPGAPQLCAPCSGQLPDLCGGWPQAGARPCSKLVCLTKAHA